MHHVFLSFLWQHSNIVFLNCLSIFHFAASTIFSIKIPYPLVGSFTKTWVTAPISLSFCKIGLPLIPCTIPPVLVNNVSSVTRNKIPLFFSRPPKSSDSISISYGFLSPSIDERIYAFSSYKRTAGSLAGIKDSL